MATVSQLLSDNTWGLGPLNWSTRMCERFTSWPISQITSHQWRLMRTGLAVGYLYCRVRKVSDDSVIGTLGQIDVSTIVASPSWQYYTFNTTPADILEVQDIRITAEYYHGGATNKYIHFWDYGSDAYAGGYESQYVNGPNYNEYLTRDATWKDLTWTLPSGQPYIKRVQGIPGMRSFSQMGHGGM